MNHAIQAGARVRFIRSYPYPGGEIPSGTEGRVAYVVRTSFLLGRHEASVYLNKRRLHGIDVDYLAVPRTYPFGRLGTHRRCPSSGSASLAHQPSSTEEAQ